MQYTLVDKRTRCSWALLYVILCTVAAYAMHYIDYRTRCTWALLYSVLLHMELCNKSQHMQYTTEYTRTRCAGALLYNVATCAIQ